MTAQIPVLLSKDDYLHARMREIDEAATSRKAAGQLDLVRLRLALPGITPDEVEKMAIRMKGFEKTLSVVKVDIADHIDLIRVHRRNLRRSPPLEFSAIVHDRA